mgnify:CR=1 FL=1
MVSKTTVIKNPSGLHLRPAGVLCKEALRYKSKISFKVRTTTANAKSVLSVLGACVKSETRLNSSVRGQMRWKHWKPWLVSWRPG